MTTKRMSEKRLGKLRDTFEYEVRCGNSWADMALPLFAEIDALRAELAKAERERDAWIETARQHCGNEQYYRGLVVSIGETIGEAAYIQDDGGKVEDVLCAKVPQLVKQCNTEREYWKTFEPRALAAERERDSARADALEEAARVCDTVGMQPDCPYGRDKPGDPTWDHGEEDKCPVCGFKVKDSWRGCTAYVNNRIAKTIRALKTTPTQESETP